MTIEEEMNIRWHYGYDEGEAAGLEKGRSEGVAQERREIAKNMKAKRIRIDRKNPRRLRKIYLT